MRMFPELFRATRIAPVDDYPARLRRTLASRGAAGDCRRRAGQRAALARRLQQRLLRALLPRRPDGHRAGRGAGSLRAGRLRLHAHHRGAEAGRRDLPPHRRRLPRPALLPAGLDARRAGADERLPLRRRRDLLGAGHRRRRRQGGLHLRAGDDPLLPRRAADPEERPDLEVRRSRRPRPTCWRTSRSSWSRRCTARAATACWSGRSRPRSRSPPTPSASRPIPATSSPSRRWRSRPARPSSRRGWRRGTSTCAPTASSGREVHLCPGGLTRVAHARGLARGQLEPGRRGQGHLGAGGLSMLSRTAENLYWLARYMERAETMARLLEVGYRMALMPSAGEGYRNEWASLVAAAGSAQGFAAKFGAEFRQRDVETWLFFDRENPSSVISCIETARQNGRAVRTALTTEMWDALNGAYLELREIERRAALRGAPAAALRLDQAPGRAAARRDRGHAPAERRLRLPEPRLLPRARRQHRAAARREVLRAAADDRHGRRLDRHLPVDDAAARALGLPRLPLVLRRRVQPAQDRAFPDPEPRLPALAPALPGQGGRASRPAGARLRQPHRRPRPAARAARRARRGARSRTSSRRACTSSSPASSTRTPRSAATWPTATSSGSSECA